jgi:hypothetical protein
MFPLPYTLTFVILTAAFIISKLQYKPTYIQIALYSMLGPMEQASIILLSYTIFQNYYN